MKILFLTNAYPDFDSSYRGNFIKKMAILLRGEGYEICVVTPKIYDGSHYFEEQNDIKVYRFPFFAGNKLLIEYERIPYLRMIMYYLSGFFITIYVFFKHKSNLIHVHWVIPTGLIGVLAGALMNRPLIVTIHGTDLRMAMARPFLLKIFLYICKRARHIICVSEVQKTEIEQLGIKEETISVFPMCIDENFLEVGKDRKRSLDSGPLTVLSNRNLLPIYNVSLLIRAIPMVLKEEPNIRFFIAGDGPERENLENEVKRLNVNTSVQFLGLVPHREMPNLLTQADIYVSTSLYDGTSVSLLEAMACGTFPIVTDIPSNQEWISDGENGFLIPIGDEAAFARKIVEATKNDKLLLEASLRNHKLIEEKALWGNNVKKLDEIYEKSLQRGKDGSSFC
jgi:glycosyltransferase involved in cell wall biosynthesis